MLIYTYDGSFEGLLTAVYEAYYRHENPEKIVCTDIQEDLLSTIINIFTDKEKASKVYDSINKKISYIAMQNVYYVYLSEFENAGTFIYNYLKLGWKLGRKVDQYLSDERVLQIHNIRHKVGGEIHRMLGLLRFKKLRNGIYYAPIEPDYNIVELLAPHFVDRMADQDWIIHDTKRNLAAAYNRHEWIITDLDSVNSSFLGEDEVEFQKLWKQYFKSIAIKSRTNPRVQKQHMPVRYWRNLTEMQLHT